MFMFIFMLMGQMASFCSDNNLDKLLNEALQEIKIVVEPNQDELLNQALTELNANENSNKDTDESKTYLNKKEAQEVCKNFAMLPPVGSTEINIPEEMCPHFNAHDTLKNELVRYYFDRKNVQCFSPCCLPTALTSQTIYKKLKSHMLQVKRSFKKQTLQNKEENFLVDITQKFLIEFQQQQTIFVAGIRRGMQFNLNDAITFEDVSDGATLEHINLQFTDKDNATYKEPYKSIFKTCVTKYIRAIDSYIFKAYSNMNHN